MLKDNVKANESIKPNSKEIETLKDNFPQFFDKEGEFLLDKFKEMLRQSDIKLSKESYELKFLGKSYGRYLSSTKTETFVVPDSEENAKEANKNSQNIYIVGDNIDALKHLLGSYAGIIKCIYIDPPYNTGSDGFVYPDKFSFNAKELADKIGIEEDEAERIVNLKGKSSHSAWLTFMYPRLILARELLSDDGVIFISIDDNEQANLKLMCDEVFGESNMCGLIPYRKRTTKSDVPFGVSQDYEWVLAYAKSDKFFAGLPVERKYYSTSDYPNDRWRLSDLTTQKTETQRPNSAFNLINPKTNKEYKYNPKRLWAITKDTFQNYYDKGKIVFPDDYDFLKISIPAYRVFESEDLEKSRRIYGSDSALKSFSTSLPKEVGMNETGSKEIDSLIGDKIFTFPKPVSLIKHLLNSLHDDNSIVLDFFSGSATTAHAVMLSNSEFSGGGG